MNVKVLMTCLLLWFATMAIAMEIPPGYGYQYGAQMRLWGLEETKALLQESRAHLLAENVFEALEQDDFQDVVLYMSLYDIPGDYQRKSDGKTFLMQAIENIKSDYWIDYVRLFLKYGANPNAIDHVGNSIFNSPILNPDKFNEFFAEFDQRAKKYAEVDVILQVLIQKANEMVFDL